MRSPHINVVKAVYDPDGAMYATRFLLRMNDVEFTYKWIKERLSPTNIGVRNQNIINFLKLLGLHVKSGHIPCVQHVFLHPPSMTTIKYQGNNMWCVVVGHTEDAVIIYHPFIGDIIRMDVEDFNNRFNNYVITIKNKKND